MRLSRLVFALVFALIFVSLMSPVWVEGAARYIEIKNCLEHSTFAFIGTVIAPHASTMPDHIVPNDSTFIVSVDDTLIVPRRLQDHFGQKIMLVSKGHAQVAAGEQFFFFVTGFFHGTSMAAEEACRFPVDGDSLQIRNFITQSQAEIANDNLKERLKIADVVVFGVVSRTSPFTGGTPQPRIDSEHNPDWWEAQVQVVSTEKGKARSSLNALFAHSQDVAWIHAPKLVARPDSVILILTKTDVQEFDIDVLTITHPLDVHPPQELRRIRRLLTEVRTR